MLQRIIEHLKKNKKDNKQNKEECREHTHCFELRLRYTVYRVEELCVPVGGIPHDIHVGPFSRFEFLHAIWTS